MLLTIIFIVLLLLMSAFFSSTEMAFVTSNKLKIIVKAQGSSLASRSSRFYVEHPHTFFTTILIGNNIANITYASVSAYYLTTLGFDEFSILLISTVIVLFLGEILPKYFAGENGLGYYLRMSVILRVIGFILYPFVRTAEALTKKVTDTEKKTEENLAAVFHVDEMDKLVKESQEAGVVSKKESDMIRKIFEMRDHRISDCMRPRTEIVGVEINSSIDECFGLLIDSGYSKLPVYENDMDTIKGMVLAYDLFKYPASLGEIIRDVIHVPEMKHSIDMLNDFMKNGMSLAVVVDEFGGTAGIVTIEDIIEEFFGEIHDEYDTEEQFCKKINDTSFVIAGNAELDYLEESFGLTFEHGDYKTLAGYILTKTGTIPQPREKIILGTNTFHILKGTKVKVELVKLLKL